MTTPTVRDRPLDVVPPRRVTWWPLWGVPAGVLGLAAAALDDGAGGSATGAAAASCGLLAAICLIVLGAQWRRQVERRFDGSAAAPVVGAGLLFSAVALALAQAWAAAVPVAWLGVLTGGAALSWMGWHEHLVSRALGSFTGVVSLAVAVAVPLTEPGLLPLVAGLELVVVAGWLALGRGPLQSLV
ncbi:hypothetical protein [Nocardioides sp. SYSU D00038]|uniref:hypothetical protein n=1 Tax=Nocardioides sp. SYSU D00038 TaxID=2812554 RepID=UPI0019681F07|nr:hypothetical protein [Nocardioides sp. SYSU D00038]